MGWRNNTTILLSGFVVISIFITFPVSSDGEVPEGICSDRAISFPAGPRCFFFVFYLSQVGVFK